MITTNQNPSFVYTKADSYLQTQCLDCLYHLPASLTLALDVREATALYAFVFNIAHVRLNVTVTVSAVWQHWQQRCDCQRAALLIHTHSSQWPSSATIRCHWQCVQDLLLFSSNLVKNCWQSPKGTTPGVKRTCMFISVWFPYRWYNSTLFTQANV